MMRITRGSPATLGATFYDVETPYDVDDTVTVTITRADGSLLITGTAVPVAVGKYTYELPPQAQVASLTVEWAGERNSVPVTVTTRVEVVGGEFFSIPELRAYDEVLQSTTRFPTDRLTQARLAVEAEFEDVCHRAFVPRYARDVLIGEGASTLWLSKPQPLRILSCTVNGDAWDDMAFYVPEYNLRVISLESGVWPRDGRIVIEYEYGMPSVPIRVKYAALKRAKYALVASNARIDERATVMNVPDFGNFVLSTPGIRGAYTGIPEVDVVLSDYELGSL